MHFNLFTDTFDNWLDAAVQGGLHLRLHCEPLLLAVLGVLFYDLNGLVNGGGKLLGVLDVLVRHFKQLLDLLVTELRPFLLRRLTLQLGCRLFVLI